MAEEKLRFLMSLKSKEKKVRFKNFSEQNRRSVHKELCRPEGRTHFLKFRYSLENHKFTDGDNVHLIGNLYCDSRNSEIQSAGLSGFTKERGMYKEKLRELGRPVKFLKALLFSGFWTN